MPVSPPEEILAIKSDYVIEKDQIEIIKVKENLIFNNLKLILKLFKKLSVPKSTNCFYWIQHPKKMKMKMKKKKMVK